MFSLDKGYSKTHLNVDQAERIVENPEKCLNLILLKPGMGILYDYIFERM